MVQKEKGCSTFLFTLHINIVLEINIFCNKSENSNNTGTLKMKSRRLFFHCTELTPQKISALSHRLHSMESHSVSPSRYYVTDYVMGMAMY